MPVSRKWKKTVPLFLWECSGVNRSQWPITTGVPFPRRALRNEKQIRLRDGKQELPVEGRVTARWPDDSIRWLLLDFQVDLLGNEKKTLTLQFGAKVRATAKPEASVTVKQSSDRIVVENGDRTILFHAGGRMPFQQLLYRGKPVLTDGAALCSLAENGNEFFASGKSVKVRIEQQTALRVVVRSDGKFTARDGTTCLDLTTRTYVFAGKAFLRIYHTITNREGRDVLLDAVSLSLPTAPGAGGEGYVTAQGLDKSIHKAEGGKAVVAVRTMPVPETQYHADVLGPHVSNNLQLMSDVQGTTERKAAGVCVIQTGDGPEHATAAESYLNPMIVSGVVCAEGRQVALGCRDFYPQAPKRIEVNDRTIRLALYWNFDGQPLRFWRGTAKTHELHVVVRSGPDLVREADVLNYKRLMIALQEPVAPTFGGSNWFQKTRACGPLFPYAPDKYPWIEFMFRRMFEQWRTNPGTALRGSTVLDFGDSWVPGRGGQWQNNEMDFGAAMLFYMLRTGYPKPFPAIEAILHHMLDVDTHHEAENPDWVGAQRYHQVRHGANTHPRLCHTWLEGPLFFYFLTGYERGREVAQMRADYFCREIEAGRHRKKSLERVQGWPLVALSTMNEHFPNARYIKACESILDWLEQWIAEDGDLVYSYLSAMGQGKQGGSILGRGVIGQGLAHYHRLTGDRRAFKLLTKSMTLAARHLFTPEGLGTKTSLLRRNYYAPGESDFILEPLGYLWEKTGERKWMRLGILNFKLALIQRDPIKGDHMGVGGGACEPYRYWPPFLYYADKSGMLKDVSIY